MPQLRQHGADVHRRAHVRIEVILLRHPPRGMPQQLRRVDAVVVSDRRRRASQLLKQVTPRRRQIFRLEHLPQPSC